MSEIYPLTILVDRYRGCYSKGKYTAWRLNSWLIPDEVDGDDPEIKFPSGICVFLERGTRLKNYSN